MNLNHLPFNKPCLAGRELEYVAQSIKSGWISGDGAFTKKCQSLLAQRLAAPGVLLTTSCTHALEMAAILLNIKPGDEIITPSFTFVSTVNAFVLRGAKPVFCDIRPDTLNMDEARIGTLISPRTRAIVPVHYAGVGCEMDVILNHSKQHGIPVVEDNAHGLFARYRGRLLGTFGQLSTQSFHETKNISCGEGGALIINDHALIERAEILREKGTNRSRFFRGQIDKYTWVDVGSSYVPSDMLAAFLLAQLEAADQIQTRRRTVWEYYYQHLQDWAASCKVRLPVVPPHCDQAYHMFYMLLPSLEKRQAFIVHLKARSISSVFHYVPLHLSPMGLQTGETSNLCPVTEDVSNRLVRLPFYNDLTEAELERIVMAVKDFAL